ncbi:MAG: hypothetical protein AAGD11_05055 [Planctomycetota bacterium]
MPAIFILALLVIVAAAIFGGIHASRKAHERQQAMLQHGSKLGWSFDASRNYDHDERFRQFGIFTTGESRYAYNTLLGSITIDDQAWPAQMGDYHYTTTSGSGKNRRTTTHNISYLLIDTPYDSAPDLRVRREHLFDRMASFVGFDDIDFESAEFSDKFHVKSSDKRFAYDVIHPRMMDFLLHGNPPTLHFERGVCCIHSKNKRWEPSDFATKTSWLADFFALWPAHVTLSQSR